ncbi:unnamed protein product [Rhizophagus irregularis]|nr:unnamed protein product [Rhizophagus irregularis]
MLITILISLTSAWRSFSQQDIKHVELTQNKESKMSDKTKESDKTKTPDKLDKFLAESLLSRRQSEPVV